MRRCFLYILLMAAVFMSCSRGTKTVEEPTPIDTIPMLVTQIQKCSRLYTSEYKIHKIVTHSDNMKLKGSIMRRDFDIDLPVGSRRIAIPMTATLKAYVDMSHIEAANIKRNGNKITVTLPDPQLVMTSTKIENEKTRQYVAFMRSDFSDEELADYMNQGRSSIINSIPKMGVIENARASAARTIIPIMAAAGYKEGDVTVVFRKNFTDGDIRSFLRNTIESNGKDN